MNLVQRYLWLILGFLGLLGFAIVWRLLPHKAEIESIWHMIFKLSVFLIIILSIAFFPNKMKQGHLLGIIPFFIFTGYMIPRLSYFGFSGAAATGGHAVGGEFYTILYLLTYPGIVLTVTFAYRLGGGTPGNCVKMALSGVMILFSGYLDVLWFQVNPVSVPAKLEYAHHISVFFGRHASYREGIVFAVCHIPLMVTLLILPLDKWLERAISVLSNAFEGRKIIEQKPEVVGDAKCRG